VRPTVVVFDSLGHQAELSGRLRCTWRCDCRIGATRLGRGGRCGGTCRWRTGWAAEARSAAARPHPGTGAAAAQRSLRNGESVLVTTGAQVLVPVLAGSPPRRQPGRRQGWHSKQTHDDGGLHGCSMTRADRGVSEQATTVGDGVEGQPVAQRAE
jgi:hypothetical protein